MSNTAGVTQGYFTIASETFEDNLSSSIAANAAIVPVNNASEYDDGDWAVLTVDVGTNDEATFVGKKNGNQFELCKWTEGNLAVGHALGATVTDYDSSTHHNLQTKGLKKIMNDDATLKTQPVRDALGLGSTAANGWEVAPYTFQVSSGYNKGCREFDVTVPNQDVTGAYSEGQRFKWQRSIAPGTQCLDLENSLSQYATRIAASLSGTLTVPTDDITIEAWVKLESYDIANGNTILSRYGAAGGYRLYVNPDSTIDIVGYNTTANYKQYKTFAAVVLGEWVHIAANLDMSNNIGHVYFNGIEVSGQMINGGTAPGTFSQTGDLAIGNQPTASRYFDGMISDVRVWNTLRTQLQIRDNMYQQLTGLETNLIGYWKLSGNLNDSTANANHLTGSGGAVPTTNDNPFSLLEYAILVKKSYTTPNTTLTFVTPKGGSIPNMVLTAPYYSAQKAPSGFPASRNKWSIKYVRRATDSQSGAVNSTFYNLGSNIITVPIGSWEATWQAMIGATGTSGNYAVQGTLSNSPTTESDPDFTAETNQSPTSQIITSLSKTGSIEVTTQTPYYLNTRYIAGGGTVTLYNLNLDAAQVITLVNAYV